MPQVKTAQANEFERCEAAYQEAIDELNGAIESFNVTIQTEFDEELQPKIDAVNESIADLKQISAEIRDWLQEYYDERSENWQYGEKGQAYTEWMERFGEIEYNIEDVSIEVPVVDEVQEETIDAELSLDY